MIRYLGLRALFYSMAGFTAIALNFLIPRLMPGDPASIMFAQFQGKMPPEALDALQESFGLSNEPLPIQFLTYLQSLLQGDFGISLLYYPSPVSEVMTQALGWTVLLAGTALIISFVIGTLLGIAAAWKREGFLDKLLPPSLAFIGAFPYFWLAMLCLSIFGFELGWFPTRHAIDPQLGDAGLLAQLYSMWTHAFLPGLTMVVASLGGWLMAMRNTMIAELGTDYIHYAQIRGLSNTRVALAYAARNALLPSVTSFGMALGFVLSGALLTEVVFGYPGQGYLLIQAVNAQDYPLMQGIFLSITAAVLLANFLVDAVQLVLDPRLRTQS